MFNGSPTGEPLVFMSLTDRNLFAKILEELIILNFGFIRHKN